MTQTKKYSRGPSSKFLLSQQSSALSAGGEDLEDNAKAGCKRPTSSHDASQPQASTNHRSLFPFIFVSILLTDSISSCLAPFFPSFVKRKYEASNLMVGVLFAVVPLCQLLVSLSLASIFYTKRMRPLLVRHCLGLILLASGCLIFALSSSLHNLLFGRLVQGLGSGLINVTGLQLVIQHSSKIEHDVGFAEFVASIANIIGPILGGFLFETLGFQQMFVAFVAVTMTLSCSAVLLLWRYGLLFKPAAESDIGKAQVQSAEEDAQIQIEKVTALGEDLFGGSPKSSPVRGSPLVYVAVAWCMLAAIVTSGEEGFLNISLAEHLKLVLHISEGNMGLLFAVSDLVCCLSTVLISRLLVHIRPSASIFAGLAILSIGLILSGPIPLLDVDLVTDVDARWTLLLSLTLMGLGEALVYVPALPYMASALSSTAHQSCVAGLYTTAYSLGEFIGPLIGGLLSDLVPHVKELLCKTSDYGNECISAYPWASFAYSVIIIVVLILGILVVVSPSFCRNKYKEVEGSKRCRDSTTATELSFISCASPTGRNKLK